MKGLLIFTFVLLTQGAGCEDMKKSNATEEPSEITSNSVQMEQTPTQNDLMALGTEPFWSLHLSKDRATLTTMQDTIITPMAPVFQEGNELRYTIETEAVKLNIRVRNGECVNQMSGQLSPYSVAVSYMYTADTKFQELQGCGSYQIPESLNGLWTLKRLMGRDMAATDFGRDIPSINFNSEKGTFNGSTGCNRMTGSLEIGHQSLSFERIMATKAMCGHGQENEDAFMQALADVDSYTQSGDQLYLKHDDGVLMTLHRAE